MDILEAFDLTKARDRAPADRETVTKPDRRHERWAFSGIPVDS